MWLIGSSHMRLLGFFRDHYGFVGHLEVRNYPHLGFLGYSRVCLLETRSPPIGQSDGEDYTYVFGNRRRSSIYIWYYHSRTLYLTWGPETINSPIHMECEI